MRLNLIALAINHLWGLQWQRYTAQRCYVAGTRRRAWA